MGHDTAVCVKTGDRYVRDIITGHWKVVNVTFNHLDDLQYKRLANKGIDADASYKKFIAEILVQPPDRLLFDLSLAPVFELHKVSAMQGSALFIGGWKNHAGRKFV